MVCPIISVISRSMCGSVHQSVDGMNLDAFFVVLDKSARSKGWRGEIFLLGACIFSLRLAIRLLLRLHTLGSVIEVSTN